MTEPLDIAGRRIGRGEQVFVIAEAGVNHNGNLELARELIDVAAESGADAVKFQTFRTSALTSARAEKAEYQKRNTGGGESQAEMLARLELSGNDFESLARYCESRAVMFLSTPFDEESADLLERIGMPAFKIASGELTNTGLLEHVAAKGKPMIVSTGMATLSDVEAAVDVIAGRAPLALLHCVSDYPAEPETVNLRAMKTLARSFGVVAGYSDHTLGTAVTLAAVALGAAIIEKHFTLDRTMPGPDHRASLEPAELRQMVLEIRQVSAALGDGIKRPTASERSTAAAARRSLTASRNIDAGEVIAEDAIILRRPGTGLPPSMLRWVVGRIAGRPIEEGEPFSVDMLR